MECKKIFSAFAIFLTIFFANAASKKEKKAELAKEISEENNWQTFEWQEENSDAVWKYEIVVEKFDRKKKTSAEIFRAFTEGNETSFRISPPLSAGSYRIKIVTYNLFEIPESESDWTDFEIQEAFQPEIKNVSAEVTHSSTIFLDEYNDGIFYISGKNLFAPKENDGEISFTEYALENAKKNQKIVPEILHHDNAGKNLTLKFSMSDLDVGTYHFTATDASGLTTEKSGENQLTIKYRKWLDVNVSAGYAIPIIAFDETIKNYLGKSVWPLSAAGKISVIPYKRKFGYLGVGISATYTRMSAEASWYTVDGNLVTAHLNAIYQFPLKFKNRKKMMLEVHGGLGGTLFNNFTFHFNHGIESETLNSLNPGFDAGAAVQFFITRRIFAEADADFIFSKEADMMMGMVVPSVQIGFQF